MRRWIAERLERGVWGTAIGRACSRPWTSLASPVRPVVLPKQVAIIGVGGLRLGGDGKTPVALALCRALAEREKSVALLARDYPRRLGEPRRIEPTDSARDVGDEPRLLANALSPLHIPVFAGGSRRAGLDALARRARLGVVDGLLQTQPQRLDLSILVSGSAVPALPACPPAGDFRASLARSLAAADVVLSDGHDPVLAAHAAASGRPYLVFETELCGVHDDRGEPHSLGALSGVRVGLVLAIARPERVVQALLRVGIRPSRIDLYGDHQVPRAKQPALADVDVWLTSEKCATKLGPSYRNAPVWSLDHHAKLPPELIDRALATIRLHPHQP